MEEENLEEIKQKNKELVKRYPWLYPVSEYTGKPLEEYDYSFTWMDDIPTGWRVAFGDQMVQELDELLRKYNCLEDYSILQIKEKFGGLRWYDSGFPEEGYDEYKNWLLKYEDLSFNTCINCGKPAKYFTKGWIVPICEDCAKKYEYGDSQLSLIEDNNI